MNVDYAFLANSAEVGLDGKLYIMGGDFDQLYGQYPLTVRSMALVVKIVFLPEECGKKYRFSVEFCKPDRKSMEPNIKMDFDTSPISVPDRKGAATFILSLQGMVFPEAGVYTIRILLDGEEKKMFRLFAEEVPTKPAGTPVTVA